MPEVFFDASEFLMNLKKIKNFGDPLLVEAMEKSQNKVVVHAKANHKAPPKRGHPDDRFYTRSGNLVRSIRPDKVKENQEQIEADVLAGTPSLVSYAADIEFGNARHRAYPFLKPALSETENEILSLLSLTLKRIIGG